jgi:polysaccharide biosynthesis/export protein
MRKRGHGGWRVIASGVPTPTNEVLTKCQCHTQRSCRTVGVQPLRSIKNDAVGFVGDRRGRLSAGIFWISKGRKENGMRPDRTAAGCILRRRCASALYRWVGAAALVGALAFSSGLSAQPAVDSRSYKLAPGDRIAVTVFNEPDLSGDFVIDDMGHILLPFLDPIEVTNLTLLECQKLVRDRLADGILAQPSVSVRISELRPLYVLGHVRLPGAYPFRYGSTVQSAVAAAGGFGPTELLQGAAVSEFLLADERVRQLSLQKQTFLVRRARLEAQRDGMTAFTPAAPPATTEGIDIAALIANEKRIFDIQAAILQDQLHLLNSQKPRIANEIEALNGQVITAKKQIEFVKQHSEQYNRLVKQGLGVANTELQINLAQASHESELWRVTAQISRLQKDTGEIDIKIQEVESSFKRQIETELREVRDRLNELDVTLPAAREIRNVKLQYAGGLIEIGVKRSISVTRTLNGEATVLPATETTPLQPGDIIDVKQLLPRESHQSAQVSQYESSRAREVGRLGFPVAAGMR